MQKRVLILTKRLDGGTGTFVLNLIKLEKITYSKIVLKVAALERPLYRNVEHLSAEYFSEKGSYPEKYTFKLKAILKIVRETFWAKKIIKNTKPDILLCIDPHAVLVGHLSLIFESRTKIIANIHNNIRDAISSKSSLFLQPILKRLFKYVLSKSDRIICVSQALSSDIKDYFSLPTKLEVIYNGVEIPQKLRVRKFKKSDQKLLSIARFNEQKDHLTLLKAFSMVVHQYPNVNLWLLGDGPTRKGIQRKALKMGVDKKVKFMGWLQNPDKVFEKSDIFILSSFREGMPFVLLEAMCYGLPIISTDSPFGPSEILHGGKYGILIPMKDPKAMSQAIISVLNDRKKYEHYSKMSTIRTQFFTLDKMLKSYEKFILGLN